MFGIGVWFVSGTVVVGALFCGVAGFVSCMAKCLFLLTPGSGVTAMGVVMMRHSESLFLFLLFLLLLSWEEEEDIERLEP